jgi:two-component system phosphate regulon response regulator OmpR
MGIHESPGVDDEDINLPLLEKLLQPLQLKLTSASNGLEARNLLADLSFDILLFDIRMPENDGIELTRWTREQSAYKDVPLLILTSLSDKQTLLDSFDAEAVDYLPLHLR